MALAANALTDYATVAAELGLSGSTDQTLIERLIGVASQALEDFCGRKLAYLAGITETLGMPGGPTLLLDRTPLVTVNTVTSDAGSPAISDVSIDEPDVGTLWSDTGWPWSANLQGGSYRPNFTADQQPGTEDKTVSIGYAGGYITSPQAYGSAAWPGATKTIDPGTLCIPAGQPTQLWLATATTAGADLVTSATEPTWPATPTAPKWGAKGDAIYTAFYGGGTKVDGAVTWLYLGTCGATGARGTAATLPPSLEEACVLTAIARYRARKRDPNIKAESLSGMASVTYADPTGLPAEAIALASQYRRFV